MPATEVVVFTDIFTSIDGLVTELLSSKSTNLVAYFSPIMQSGFAIYMVLLFSSYWQGMAIEGALVDVLKRVGAWALVITFAANVGNYNDVVVPFVMGFGDEMAQSFTGSTIPSHALDTLAGQALDVMSNNKENDGLNILEGGFGIKSAFENVIYNTVFVLSIFIFLVIAAGFLIVTKVFLALLALVGPIFIGAALFPATRQYFSAWLNQVLNYGFLVLFINVTASIFLNYMDRIIEKALQDFGVASAAGTVVGFTGLGHGILAAMTFVAVMMKLPEVTAGLMGGIAASGLGNPSNMIGSSAKRAFGALGNMRMPLGKAPKSGGSMRGKGPKPGGSEAKSGGSEAKSGGDK